MEDVDKDDSSATVLVLSAAADGSIHVSSAQSGNMCYRLDGFTNQLSSMCVCANQNALVTDGMDHLVCLHDFDADEDIDGSFDLVQ